MDTTRELRSICIPLSHACRDMGNQPAAPRAGSGEPRHQDESFHDVRHGVAQRDGATVAGARPDRRIRFATQETEARSGGEPQVPHADLQGRRRAPLVPEQSPAHDDDDGVGEARVRMPPRRPSYVPLWQRRGGEGQPHAAPPRPVAGHRPPVPAPHAGEGVPEETRATPVVPIAGARPPGTTLRTSNDDGGAAAAFQQERPPPRGPRYVPPTRSHPKKTRWPVAFCCILFWLLVIAVGVAVLVVFLVYHPKPPQLRVASATLNAGYVDDDARALSADVTVLAAISNPNTKLHIVLRYMQLDLYFEDTMIGTQAVWPAPLHEDPRGSVVRSVHLVVSNVTMPQKAVLVWQNAASNGGGPVVTQLAGRFHTQLNFGQWLRYRYWVKLQCTLWFDPPPSGALRRSQC